MSEFAIHATTAERAKRILEKGEGLRRVWFWESRVWAHHPLKLWPTYPVYLFHFKEFEGSQPAHLSELKARVHRALRTANYLAEGTKSLPLAYHKLVLFVVDSEGLKLKKSGRDPRKFKVEHVPASRLTPIRLTPEELERLRQGASPEVLHARVLDRLAERVLERLNNPRA